MSVPILKARSGRSGIVTALDVGSTKVACFIAQIDDEDDVHIIGVGHQTSHGLRNGAVVDMEAARESIAAAVETAERISRERVRRVIVNLSCGRFHSETGFVETPLQDQEVGPADVRRVMDPGRLIDSDEQREVIHAIPTGFHVDDITDIRDPLGLHGSTLGVDFHLVMAEPGPVRTLVNCIADGHLEVEALVVSAFASGLASAVDDELDLGATVIDMGAGATTAAVFEHGELQHTECLAIGGHHVTKDIAQGLSAPASEAERIKRLYGDADPSAARSSAMIQVSQIGTAEGDPGDRVPKSRVNDIVAPRLEETFELIRDRLRQSAAGTPGTTRFVLTGGASQMRGVRELAESVFGYPVRLGRPARLPGLAEAMTGPGFATCAGLVTYAANHRSDGLPGSRRTGTVVEHRSGRRGVINRISHWLHENF